MTSRVNDILNLEKVLKQEKISHLQLKANQSSKLAELSTKESVLSHQLTVFHESLSREKKKEGTKNSSEIQQLNVAKVQLEDEIKQLEKDIAPIEQQLIKFNADSSIIKSKIEVLVEEKKELEKKDLELKKKQIKNKRTSNKVKNELEKLTKIKNRIEQQEKIKNNLGIFLRTLDSIKQVISNYSPLTESVTLPSDITEEIQEQIIHSKKYFDEAQTGFDPNNLTSFLVAADESYRNIVFVFIKLCDNIPNSLLEKEFSEIIFTLFNKGFTLNTRHLNAVHSMLSKLEKGVEIAPLASFANEIKEYFVENLTYLRVTGGEL
ncbi:MAG: hypothetical protein ACXADY_08340 [Candidatus Hodarchaeales archaeon]